MPLAIKHIASDTTANAASTFTLYTVPAGRVAKILISSLFTEVAGSSFSRLLVGNATLPGGTTFGVQGGADYKPGQPLEHYLGAGQTVVVNRQGGDPTRCTVQFVAIEEAAS